MQYRISTITAVGSLSCPFDLPLLFECIPVTEEEEKKGDDEQRVSITFVEYVRKDGVRRERGYRTKKKGGGSTFSDKKRDIRQGGEDGTRVTDSCVLVSPHSPDASNRCHAGQAKARHHSAAGFSVMSSSEKEETWYSQNKQRQKQQHARHFDNQMTVVLRVPVLSEYSSERELEIVKRVAAADSNKGGLDRGGGFSGGAGAPAAAPSSASEVNIKIFKNGNVQITGIKTVEQGGRCLQHLANIIRNAAFQQRQDDHMLPIKEIEKSKGDESGARSCFVSDPDLIKPAGYKVCLINSDSKVEWNLRRDKLYDVLSSKYSLICGFEPCIYPGVKIQYAWNRSTLEAQRGTPSEGTCCCKGRCTGKGTGNGEGDCRRITIAVFRSGCIIVTGAHTYDQLDDAYAFLKRILDENKHAILSVPSSSYSPRLSSHSRGVVGV